jgi:hypothetical protein
MFKKTQIYCFFIFNHIFFPSIDYDLIMEIEQFLPNELLEIENNRQVNVELDEHFNEDNSQQILDINFEDNFSLEELFPASSLEFTQQEPENNYHDLNETYFNNE